MLLGILQFDTCQFVVLLITFNLFKFLMVVQPHHLPIACNWNKVELLVNFLPNKFRESYYFINSLITTTKNYNLAKYLSQIHGIMEYFCF